MKRRWGLWPYLFATAALSIAVGLGAVGFGVQQVATHQFQLYAHRRNAVVARRVSHTLQLLYQRQGWNGVIVGTQHFAEVLGTPITLLSPSGRVLLNVAPLGKPAPRSTPSLSVRLRGPHGRLLATVILRDPPALDPQLSPVLKAIESALIWASVVGFLAALALSGLIGERVARPLQHIAEGVRRLGGGDLSHRVPIEGPQEVASLANDFNRMAAALESSEASRQQLVADVAHELRTPLSILRGYLEAIADGVELPGPDPIDTAVDQARRLTRLVDDLQELALADVNQLAIEKELMDIGPLITNLVNEWRLEAQRHQITMITNVPTDLPPCLVDPRRIGQALANFLANALKYTPSGGQITVSATSTDSSVTISVTDTGPGIAEEDLSHVFDRLYRVDRARTTSTGGFGLGLAITKNLVQLHGGDVGVESIVGHGSCFWIKIPAETTKS